MKSADEIFEEIKGKFPSLDESYIKMVINEAREKEARKATLTEELNKMEVFKVCKIGPATAKNIEHIRKIFIDTILDDNVAKIDVSTFIFNYIGVLPEFNRNNQFRVFKSRLDPQFAGTLAGVPIMVNSFMPNKNVMVTTSYNGEKHKCLLCDNDRDYLINSRDYFFNDIW